MGATTEAEVTTEAEAVTGIRFCFRFYRGYVILFLIMSKKYLIVGAGPAGLTLACSLLKKGIKDIQVLEKEACAGGLCRSETVDSSPLDIGGGHFLDVRRPAVDDFLFEYMPRDEWDRYERDSRIQVGDNLVGHPLEANIWQMKLDDQVEYLKSIAAAGCNTGAPMPEKFVDWIFWKLGQRIAEDYMIPYNKKMFAEDLDSLGTYWLEKLPDVSFEDTLRSCLTGKAYGKQPGHAEFFYPKKYGYGEVWLRMAESLGDRLICSESAVTLDLKAKTVNDKYEADVIINTAPWAAYSEIRDLPEDLKEGIGRLRTSSIVVDYYPENLDTKAQWIYYPDDALCYHRILVRHNFCPGSKGYWTETNASRLGLRKREPSYSCLNEYAYPLNTIGKPEFMAKLLNYLKGRGVIGLGRWGEHSHYNSDLVVELGMKLADELE